MTADLTDAVPYFDIARPGFSIKSAEVYAARERSWYARTNYGLAILRYDEVSRLAKHPKLRQGSVAWPAHNGVTTAVQTFLAHPDQWRLLAERPELGRAAVEEVMRVNPTVTWVTREALEDFTFGGLDIAAGTTVHLFAQCAGTDPRAFGEAGFDITAKHKPHFGFGSGIHHCIGHYVARRDMAEALPLLARRMRDPHIDGEASWLPDSGNTGPVRLPLAFTPAR